VGTLCGVHFAATQLPDALRCCCVLLLLLLLLLLSLPAVMHTKTRRTSRGRYKLKMYSIDVSGLLASTLA